MSDSNRPDVSICISPHAEVPKGVDQDKLREQAEFVLEILGAYLPEDYPLDGLPETEFRLGDSGKEPRYKRLKNRSVCYVEGFDFKAWKKAKADDRIELVLDAVSDMIDRLVQAFRGDRNALKKAVREVRRAGFEAEVEETKLSVDPQGIPFEFKVLRHITRKGEDWGVEVQKRDSRGRKRSLHKEWIAKNVDSEKARTRYRKSRWKESQFALLNSSGKVTYEYALEDPAIEQVA